MTSGHVAPLVTTGDKPATGDSHWITVTEACARSGVAKRTVRRWIAESRVVSRLEGEPGREVRYLRADTLPPMSATSDVLGEGTGGSTGATVNHADSSGRGDDTGDRGSDATRDSTSARGDTGLERLVTAQEAEIQQLRAQLEVRNHAEAELRRLLLSAQQLAHELAQQLEVKALPPGPVETKASAKVRWWALWKR